MSFVTATLLTYVMALIAMAFYTLLERKALGYFQLRKGPNKVGFMGLLQPFADALKLFLKEQTTPLKSNGPPFLIAPMIAIVLALTLWALYPHTFPTFFFSFGVMFFLCISSLTVYATLAAGWTSNSKYALIGALRGVAQTISYEVSMALILLCVLLLPKTFNLVAITNETGLWPMLVGPPLVIMWFVSSLAETNRTPFDFAEGESELVSGFNVEYSATMFALIFMAEYMSILIMSVFTTTFFAPSFWPTPLITIFFSLKTLFIAFLFIWVRATLPRMRYDRLMALTWLGFLPTTLSLIILFTPLSLF